MRTTSITNNSLLAQDRANLVHPLHDLRMHANDLGRVWVKGEGAILTDADGVEVVDGLSGLWNVTAGHGRRELADAMHTQAETLAYCSGYSGSSNLSAIELATRLSELSYPSINHFFFTSGGAEATESSIKMARAYWKIREKPHKIKFISRTDSYHGVTLAAMSATGISMSATGASPYWTLFEPRVPGFKHIASPYPYRYKAPKGVSQGIAAANELETAILNEGADTVAAFIAEPIQGAGGVISPQDDYFQRIRAICNEYDVLFIADEVITGFGRTGKLFALDHWGVEPDIVQFAKAITSGYFPFGGIGINDKLMQTLHDDGRPWMHAYTYSAHPVGCAVALRTLQIINEEGFPEQAATKGNYLINTLKTVLDDHPHVGNIRGKGLMCAIELVQDKTTKQPFPKQDQIGLKIQQTALQKGLFSRIKEDNYLLAPPIIISNELLDRSIEILNEAIVAVLG